MSLCSRKRIKDPTGNWGYFSMLGAKVHIKSTPISNFFGTYCCSDTYVIKDISFQVSLDGKTITVIILDGLEDKFFTWKDLEIVEVGDAQLKNSQCGEFNCGESICGRGVDHEPTWIESIGNGLAIIDSKGNVISGRYIRINNAEIEDITTDQDDITDITFNGGIIK